MARQFSIIPFRALKDRRLHPSDKLVLSALGGHTDTTGRCWPAIRTLMEHSGLRERTVQRALRRLEVAGYVQMERREGRSTVYRVLFDTGDTVSPPPLEGVTTVPGGTQNEGSNGGNTPSTTPTLPVHVATALEPYLRSHRFPGAARQSVAMLLHPEASPSYTPDEVALALTQMAAEGRPFKATSLAAWCQNLRQGPLPPRGRTNGGRVGSNRLSFLDALPAAPEEP